MARFAALGAVPRLLADDFLVTVVGPDPLFVEAAVIEAVDETPTFIELMGGTSAPGKSKLFGSTAALRASLGAVVWPRLNTVIGVAMDFRDLGAHIDTSFRRWGTTLTKRLLAASSSAKRVAILRPYPTQACRVTRGKIIPMATYGAETTPVAETHLKHLPVTR